MDFYIGVKLIQASPAKNSETQEDGYNVLYADGYTSWSPKEVFESAYLKLDDQTRITPAVVDSMIANASTGQIDPKTALVKCVQVTGFVDYATASCVDPNNYDNDIGHAIGMKVIRDNIWNNLGFVLQWARHGLKHVRKSDQGA